MRVSLSALLSAFGVCLVAPACALADQNDPRLDGLFAALRAPQGSAADAVATQARIEEIWFVPPETGIGILFDRAVMALNAREPALALDLVSHVNGLAPSYAEGWVLAGHAHSAAGDSGAAARAYAEAVRLEPRHFTALTRLGDLAVEAGDKRGGLRRYREALLLNPHLDAVRARADGLRDEIGSREI